MVAINEWFGASQRCDELGGFGVTRERESQQSTINKREKRSGGPTSRGFERKGRPATARRETRELSEQWSDDTDNSAWLAYAPRGLKNPLSLLSSGPLFLPRVALSRGVMPCNSSLHSSLLIASCLSSVKKYPALPDQFPSVEPLRTEQKGGPPTGDTLVIVLSWSDADYYPILYD